MKPIYRKPVLQGQGRKVTLKSAYNSLVIGPRNTWSENLLMSDLTMGPSVKVKPGYENFKVSIFPLLLLVGVCNVKPLYRKSWTRNFLM